MWPGEAPHSGAVSYNLSKNEENVKARLSGRKVKESRKEKETASAEKKDKRRPTTLHPVRWKNTGFSDSVEHSSSSMGVPWMNWLPNPTCKVECLINGNFQKKYPRPAPSESCIFKAVSVGGHGSAVSQCLWSPFCNQY